MTPRTVIPREVPTDTVWSALNGVDAPFAQRSGDAVRYRPDVAAFAAIDGPMRPSLLSDLASLASRDHPVALIDAGVLPGWTTVASIRGFQMSGAASTAAPLGGSGVVALSKDDVADMMELAALTRPGPFLTGTVELGGYVGVRENGRLVAMAGERMHPTGCVEISAVCTHPDARGRGLGALMVLTVAAGIRARGATPFLHVIETNVNAIRLYEALGFRVRRSITIDVVHPE